MEHHAYSTLAVLPSPHFAHTSQPDRWLDHIPVHPSASTVPSSTGHAHLSPCDDLPVEPSSSFTVSAEDQWAASLFIRDIFAGRIDRSAFLPECWPESPSAYPLQVEESQGVVTSHPPPHFDPATGSFRPVAAPFEKTITPLPLPLPDSVGCQRSAHGIRDARVHHGARPQRLPRGMRKTWGPAAAGMTLESAVRELRHEGIDDAVIGIVQEIFAPGFTVAALMRKMSKDESRRYLGGEKAQVYRALLSEVQKRFQCRLCHQGPSHQGPDAMSWKHPRDVVRHLRRDHFGLGDACPSCNHVVYTTGEMTNHRCKSNQD